MLTSVRKTSGVRLAANSGVPAATFRMAAVKTSGLGITCNVHLQMQLHVVNLTAVHLLYYVFLTQNILICSCLNQDAVWLLLATVAAAS